MLIHACFSFSIVVGVDKDGKWYGRRIVEEQTPARPAWRQFMESQHPPSERNGLIRKNRIFGLIAVGGGNQYRFMLTVIFSYVANADSNSIWRYHV